MTHGKEALVCYMMIMMIGSACASTFVDPMGNTYSLPDRVLSHNGVHMNLSNERACHVWRSNQAHFLCYAHGEPEVGTLPSQFALNTGVMLTYTGIAPGCDSLQTNIYLLCDNTGPVEVAETQCSVDIVYKSKECIISGNPPSPTNTPSTEAPSTDSPSTESPSTSAPTILPPTPADTSSVPVYNTGMLTMFGAGLCIGCSISFLVGLLLYFIKARRQYQQNNRYTMIPGHVVSIPANREDPYNPPQIEHFYAC